VKLKELRSELSKGRIRPAYLIAGEEPLLRDDALASLRGAVLDGSADDFNLDRLDGRTTSPDRLRDSALALPVMSARRLVVLNEPEAARGAGGKELTAAVGELLAELLSQELSVLVVLAAKVDKRTGWYKAFKDPAAVVECAPPKGDKGAVAFIAEEARAQGVELEPGAGELLAERIGPQLLMLRQEIAKVALLAGLGEVVGRSHVVASTSQIAEESVWDLMDAIGDGRGEVALGLLSRMSGAGAAPPMVLGALASHYRKLARLRSGGSLPGAPFTLKKLERQARRYTAARLVRCLDQIHLTDTALKGAGALPPALALERLVISLSG